MLTGGPGIGKTTLWEAGIARARKRRLRVLQARPSGAETQLSFAVLADLLDEAEHEALAGLPSPQLRALDVALLRAEPADEPPPPRAIAAGLLGALRALAARKPLVVAIDDVQWLDAPSADALAFAARRLEGDAVRFLLARRSRSSSALEHAFEPQGLERLQVGPLSFGATRRLFSERLGLTLPRRVLRLTVEAAAGNPLFALELGRALEEWGLPEIGEELAVPDALEDLMGARVERLAEPVRRLLLAVSLSGDLRTAQVAEIAEPGTLEDAVEAGVLTLDRDRVRPTHPLLGAAARRRSRAKARRDLHLELASAARSDERRARHLALATERPDAELAGTLDAAAAGAAARGATEDAVQLARNALRLTPSGQPERDARLLALAEYLVVAGEPQMVTDLLDAEVDSLPPGAARVRAHLLLADGGAIMTADDHWTQLERAFAESGDDAALRAPVVARQCEHVAVGCVERVAEAESWAAEALPAARSAGPDAERLVLNALGWARIMRGRPVDDLEESYRQASDAVGHIYRSLDRVAAVRLMWRGEVNEARTRFEQLAAQADERSDSWSWVVVRMHQCELELRAGGWEPVASFLDEWETSADRSMVVGANYERCRALLAAGRGHPEEAERWAGEAIAAAEAAGIRWDLLDGLRARGLAALAAHEPERAAESLRAVWEHTQREDVDDPGAFPAAPDLVEALVELGELDEARAVTDRFGALAEAQEHPWGLVTTERCRALLMLGTQTGEDEAVEMLEQAAAAYEALGLHPDRARSLLIAGRAKRRRRQWGAARRLLEGAAAAFDELGSPGWADHARAELDRVGARRPRPQGELTPAEQRTVELAADGLSNKEIAQELVVTVHTVEVHLSHAYGKLGVRSRTQLARRLSKQA